MYKNKKKTAIYKRRNNTQNNTKTIQKQRIHKIGNKQLMVHTLSIQSHQYHKMYVPKARFSQKYSVHVLADISHLQTMYIYFFITAFYNRLLKER